MTVIVHPTATRPIDAPADLARREEIVRRYWMKGELTPLAVANSLAGQKACAAA